VFGGLQNCSTGWRGLDAKQRLAVLDIAIAVFREEDTVTVIDLTELQAVATIGDDKETWELSISVLPKKGVVADADVAVVRVDVENHDFSPLDWLVIQSLGFTAP